VLSNLRTSTGLSLDGSTTAPQIAALEINYYGVVAAASTTFMGLFSWKVPEDYDDAADELRIRVLCNMAGNTNKTVTITPTIYRKRPNYYVGTLIGSTTYASDGTRTPLTADLGCPTSTMYIPSLASLATDYTASTSNAATRWVEMVCDAKKSTIDGSLSGIANRTLAATSDASIRPGDQLQVTLAASAHTTDAINMYGLEMWYRSNLAFTTINNR
jgi:hypothetical protein